MYKSYEFQTRAENDIASLLESHKKDPQENILICIPTGGGKTVISAKGFKKFLDVNKKEQILFLVPLQCLVEQTYKTFESIGIDVSVFHNTIKTDINGKKFKDSFSSQVIISMPETFQNDLALGKESSIPKKFKPFAIAMDEAHKMTSDMNQMIKYKYPNAVVIGFTASPYRAQNKEGEHLTEWYGDNLKQYVTVQELIDIGRLVQPYYYEFEETDNIFNNWKLLSDKEDQDKRQTVIFTSNTDQSLKLKQMFLDNGIVAEIITAGSSIIPDTIIRAQTHQERSEIYKKFRNRDIQVLISVNALCEGWDEPSANICIFARGVLNMALYQQMGGRVLRAFENKEYAIIMDFGGNVDRFGPIEYIEWEIKDGNKPIIVKDGKPVTEKQYLTNRKIFARCECNHIFDIKKHEQCPSCKKANPVKVVNTVGELFKDRFPDKEMSISDIRNFLVRVSSARNYPDPIYKKKINEQYGRSIFTDLGFYTPEFKFIEGIKSHHTVKSNMKVILET